MPNKSGFDDLPLNVRLSNKRHRDNVASLRKVKLGKGRSARSTAKNRGPIRGASAPATRSRTSLSFRRVVVKARVVKMTAYGVGAAKLHLRYLDREGTSKDNEKENFYDKENSDISRTDIEAVREGEPHQFRFIVSPEDAERLDLTDYTKSLMNQVETDLGRKLDWKAINHYNTDNPHTHIVVSGLDKKGEEVYIDKEYISNGMRNRASEIATRELGHRMEHEIKQSLQKEIKAKSLTRIDHQLLRQSVNQQVELSSYQGSPAARLQRSTMLGRLTELERMGLAEKQGKDQWKLAENLKQKLRNLQQYSETVERLNSAESRLEYPAKEHQIHDVKSTHEIKGVVIDKGIRDEISDKGYFIVGDHQGKLNYIEVGSLNSYENTPVGSVVSVNNETKSWVKKSDRNISHYANRNSGNFAPEAYGEWVVSQGKVSHVKLSDFVQAHQKRLQALQRYNLVHESKGVWTIPDNLIEQLEKKSGDPKAIIRKQHQLSLDEQIKYQGCTYLDDHYHELSENHEPNGISNKFRKTVQLRAQWLQEQGLEAGTQASRNVLDEMERKSLAGDVSEKTGLSFKTLAKGDSLQGKYIGVIATKSVRRYAVVANEKEFSMVPWKKPYAPEKGQQMVIGVNQQGRSWTKQIQRGIER